MTATGSTATTTTTIGSETATTTTTLGFYEKTLIFQTLNFEILIQGIDALSWGELTGAVRFLKIQLLLLQIWFVH